MIHTIYKYDVLFSVLNTHYMSVNARPVLVGIQDEIPRVWFEQEQLGEQCARTFCIVATGQIFPDGWKHIGSFQSGSYVWHIMEVL